MRNAPAVSKPLPTRFALALGVAALTLLAGLALAAGAVAAPKPAVLTLTTAKVGDPGNPSVSIVPFEDAAYANCEAAPVTKKGCQAVGGVSYPFQIGKLEVTVAQWVAFLNTADPAGRNRRNLYSSTESGEAWPRFGQIDFRAKARPGRHYSLAAPEWADKPYGFANFLRAARFANSLYNGTVISKKASNAGSYRYVTYRVRLSRKTENGMYDIRVRKMTREHKRDFVIPSQDEWIEAAYFDPASNSYWKYPTNPGVFGDGNATAPAPTELDATNGNVLNASTQPLANYHFTEKEKELAAPYWCPSNQTPEACATVNPFGLDPETYAKAFQGSLSTVGQALTPSPWGTLDQGGNAVEWTDTIAPPRSGSRAPASGSACTAASPTPPTTSYGSRRSGCSRRKTRSTPRPIPGSASASAFSATPRRRSRGREGELRHRSSFVTQWVTKDERLAIWLPWGSWPPPSTS
jgi:formylglycine-generating enzyme required for sulfatase activity